MPNITLSDVQKCLPSNCQVEAFLSSGGQGAVFKGTFDGAPAAIKLINPAGTEKKRIDRETQFLQSLSHPNIVKVLGHREVNLAGQQVQLLVYEFLNGGDILPRIGAIPLPENAEIVRLGLDISSAIEKIWSAKERVVHRDIKPANIMVGNQGQYVLVDFGFARHIDLSDMTVMGSPGTRGFSSPEQAAGRKNLTYKSDLFSLGITLFLFATGKHPFGFNQPSAESAVSENIATLRPDLEPRLSQLILRMLKPSPAERPAHVVLEFELLEE